jgi:hypothetical protein
MTAVACGEVFAIALYHPDIWAIVRIVFIGHSAMLACCVVDVLLLLFKRGDNFRKLGVVAR